MTETSSQPPVIGIDLGATNMLLCVVDENGTIIAKAHRQTDGQSGFEHVLNNLVQGVHELCAQANIEVSAAGAIGVAVAGAVDIETGVVLDAHNLKWKNAPLREKLHQRLNLPVTIDNDVNAATWGEYLLGAGRNRGDLFGVWVGTGIGGGLVLNGELYHGAFSTAGEFGLTIITPDGEENFRTVEDHAGRAGMQRIFARDLPNHPESVLHELCQGDPNQIGTRELAEAQRREDILGGKVIDRGAKLLGIAIANFVTFLAVETVIVGGGITEALGDSYLGKVREAFAANVFPDRCRSCEIIPTKLESEAGLLGAALLARHRLRSS